MKSILYTIIVCLVLSCGTAGKIENVNTNIEKPLKDHFSNYFDIGVAVSPRALKTDEAELVKKHFNSMTAENAMKMGPLHPSENEYYWRDADSIVAFAKRNNMKMRGHALVWHQQAPDWFFTDAEGKTVSKEVLLQRMKNHITTVVNRYKESIYAWDVVNEAISDNRVEVYRKSKFFEIIGEEYIAKAFEYAHAADPNALLFYNDYNEISAVKRSKIINMIKKLRESGVPVHAVGLQAHWANNEPTRDQLETTLKEFSNLGLPLHITELDVSVYPKEHSSRERRSEDADTVYSAAKEQAQAEQYKMIFESFRKYRNEIKSVTFWNISDRSSWLDNFPVRGRKDYPLLFDRDLKPKKAFWEVIKFY
jgi:endo-1,4-beta-xylanase